MKLFISIFLIFFQMEIRAEEFLLRWGVNVEPFEYYNEASKKFKKNVEEKSEGRISVQLFKSQIPERNIDHLVEVQNGIYDMGQATVADLSSRIPELELWNLPYLFRTDNHVFKYTESTHGLEMAERLKQFGVTGIDYTYSGGFLYSFGDQIDSYKELRNKKFFFEDASGIYFEFMSKNLGIRKDERDISDFAPNTSEDHQGEIIASTIAIFENHPISKNIKITKTNHRVISRILFISTSFLETLPDDLKVMVLEEAKKAAVFERSLSINDKVLYEKRLKEKGVLFVDWNVEKIEQEKKVFSPIYESYSKKFGKDIIGTIEKMAK